MHRRAYERSTIYFELLNCSIAGRGALWPCFAAFAGGEFVVTPLICMLIVIVDSNTFLYAPDKQRCLLQTLNCMKAQRSCKCTDYIVFKQASLARRRRDSRTVR